MQSILLINKWNLAILNQIIAYTIRLPLDNAEKSRSDSNLWGFLWVLEVVVYLTYVILWDVGCKHWSWALELFVSLIWNAIRLCLLHFVPIYIAFEWLFSANAMKRTKARKRNGDIMCDLPSFPCDRYGFACIIVTYFYRVYKKVSNASRVHWMTFAAQQTNFTFIQKQKKSLKKLKHKLAFYHQLFII